MLLNRPARLPVLAGRSGSTSSREWNVTISMRRFQLHRDVDVSGEGVVADGVQFGHELFIVWPDGLKTELPQRWVRLVWRTAGHSTALYESVEQVERIHGHGGATRLVWLDEHPVEVESRSRPWSRALGIG